MKRDYFKSIGRKDYWIKLLVSTIGVIAYWVALGAGIHMVGAPGNETTAMILVISTGIAALGGLFISGFYIYYFIGLIVGRLKNIGVDAIWILGVLIVPFAWIVIGLLPTKEEL